MSAVPGSNRTFSKCAMRLLIIALAFVCVGPAIQMALESILTVCYLALSGARDAMYWTVGIAPRFVWQVLTLDAIMAGLTGLIAGICEILFGRIDARGMLAISLVIPAASVVLWIATLPPLWAVIRSGNIDAIWIFLGPTAIALLSFVASMVACWKITEMMKSRTSAAGGLSPQ